MESDEANQLRHELARKLASSFVLEPGQEIAITGSVARGVADKFSDIEIWFVVDGLQSQTVYEQQLATAGAKVDPVSQMWDGTLTTKSWYEGVFIEAAWQTWDTLEQRLRPVLQAKNFDHWALTQVWHTFHAVPLTDAPRLLRWQQELRHYPDVLQAGLIERATGSWSEPHWYPLSPVIAWALAARNVPMSLSTRLIQEVERCLRLLFAINKVWEPDYKWIWSESQRLQSKPENLPERINAIFNDADANNRVKLCFELILDSLRLVPAQYNVSLQIQRITEALQPEKL